MRHSLVLTILFCAGYSRALLCPHTPLPPSQRATCGNAATEELCVARGCCWASSLVAQPSAQEIQGSCATGNIHTPAEGVHNTSMWSTHVEFENPGRWDVQAEIAGYIHFGKQGGPGPCCGNTFNVTIENISNIGFDVQVVRTCPQDPPCSGKFIGWGQELLLAWKAGEDVTHCSFPPPITPSPSPAPSPVSPCYYSTPVTDIKTVLIIDADHLDEGYHGQVTDVNNRYFDMFWPRAMNIAKELKEGNHSETYTYTTFSWLISLFLSCPPNATGVHSPLHCPNSTYRTQVLEAIQDGVLTWNAFPFNSELSAYDSSMMRFGINHTHMIDDMLQKPRKIVFPDRDVPGVTRAMIPILTSMGVKAINEAPNGAMLPTNVPPAFIWRDEDSENTVVNTTNVDGVSPPSGEEILVMWWQEDCHGKCFRVYPGSDTAVLFDWVGEDSGPNVNSASDVLQLYAEAREQFPNATSIKSASLDDVASALLRPEVYRNLPTLNVEIGDTWSYGIQSDPKKVAQTRAAIRARASYEQSHQTQLHSLQHENITEIANPFTWWSNFSRCLLKGYEHTWGLRYDMCYGGGFDNYLSIDIDDDSRKQHKISIQDDPDNKFPYYDIPGGMANATGYMNDVFHAARNDPNGYPRRHCEPSWTDQTNWAVKWANEAIQDKSLRSTIESEVDEIMNVVQPNPLSQGFTKADISKSYNLSEYGLTVAFCQDTGAICELSDAKRGNSWASMKSPLGLFTYTLYTNDQMTNVRNEYCPNGCNPKEFGKPGMPLNTSVNATPSEAVLYMKTSPIGIEFLSMTKMESDLNSKYGSPSQVWLHVHVGSSSNISVDIILINKTATRFAEGAFITFNPQTQQNAGSGWALDKLGEWVSPLAVADGGSKSISPVNSGVLYSAGKEVGSIFFRTMDAGVVKFGDKLPFPTPVHGVADVSKGAHFLLWDNYWNTNYVFWYPYNTPLGVNNENIKFRFSIELRD
eukprot:m.344143 g.344143  ORF g.344143 m.344143 type:complete len:974 (-) comp23897_c0_seq1:105-3026(-)